MVQGPTAPRAATPVTRGGSGETYPTGSCAEALDHFKTLSSG